MSNEIHRKPEMTKANPYNDIKLLFCVIIPLPLRYDEIQKYTGKHTRGI